MPKKSTKPTQAQLLKLWRDSHREGTGVKRIGKRIFRTNPHSIFKNFYVKCDGKTFGPFKTKAKADKTAQAIARVLDKPAKVMGQVKGKTNPAKRKRRGARAKMRTKRPRLVRRKANRRR